MERRFAVHAGPDQEALITRRASRAWILALAVASLAATAGSADAKPKGRDAKLAFDRGVAAYQDGDFQGASEALGKSYQIEHDADTLFAWAQAERKLEHCDKAIELYGKLLELNLPAANKAAVEQKLEECRAMVAAQAPKAEPAPVPTAPPPPRPEVPPPAVGDHPAPAPTARAWYRDPITLALLGTGVVASGAGAGFLISAHAEHVKALDSKTLEEFGPHADKARSRRNLGVITGGAGVALVAGGAVWMFLHRGSGEQRTLTGWLAPGGGGLAITGPF